MTGYGRGESESGGAKISVELNSVNRRQSDIVINLPRDLSVLEPRVRQTVSFLTIICVEPCGRRSRGENHVEPGTLPAGKNWIVGFGD